MESNARTVALTYVQQKINSIARNLSQGFGWSSVVDILIIVVVMILVVLILVVLILVVLILVVLILVVLILVVFHDLVD